MPILTSLSINAHWKPDWRLVPRSEEKAYKEDFVSKPRPIRYVSPHVEMPPLLKYVFEHKMPAGKEMPVIERQIRPMRRRNQAMAAEDPSLS